MGVALAGLAPDARVLSNFLRKQAMQCKMVFNRPIQTYKAVLSIADKAQENTQTYGSRPYGVGLLIAGYDETGAHLFEFQPSGSVLEYFGAAIGARSQAARTYLERNLEEIKKCDDVEKLVLHGLYALRDTLAQDVELTFKNTSVSIVGKDQSFVSYDDENVQQWLDKLDSVSNARNRDGDDDEDGDEQEEGNATQAQEGEGTEAPAEDRMETDE